MAQVTFGRDTEIPSGQIIMWAGALSNIPSGWVICDGNNGTPNLMGDFLKGHPDSTSSGSIGGASSTTMSLSQMPSHFHNLSTTTDGGHAHAWDLRVDVQEGTDGNAFDAGASPGTPTSAAGAHQHTFSFGQSGGDGSATNLPSYYEIAYIMKT